MKTFQQNLWYFRKTVTRVILPGEWQQLLYDSNATVKHEKIKSRSLNAAVEVLHNFVLIELQQLREENERVLAENHRLQMERVGLENGVENLQKLQISAARLLNQKERHIMLLTNEAFSRRTTAGEEFTEADLNFGGALDTLVASLVGQGRNFRRNCLKFIFGAISVLFFAVTFSPSRIHDEL